MILGGSVTTGLTSRGFAMSMLRPTLRSGGLLWMIGLATILSFFIMFLAGSFVYLRYVLLNLQASRSMCSLL